MSEPLPVLTDPSPLDWSLEELAVELTVHCNLSCRMCSVWEGKKHGVNGELARKLLRRARGNSSRGQELVDAHTCTAGPQGQRARAGAGCEVAWPYRLSGGDHTRTHTHKVNS